MNVITKIRELISHAHAQGYASELPPSVQTPLEHLAEEIDALAKRAGGGLALDVEKLVGDVNAKVDAVLTEIKTQFAGAVEAFGNRLDAAEEAICRLDHSLAPASSPAPAPAAVELPVAPAEQAAAPAAPAPAAPAPAAPADGAAPASA